VPQHVRDGHALQRIVRIEAARMECRLQSDAFDGGVLQAKACSRPFTMHPRGFRLSDTVPAAAR
jgi:hypothetical protein